MGTCQNCPQICCYIAAAIGFVVGVLLTCIICKCRKGKCSCSSRKAPHKCEKHEERPFEKRKPHPAPADGSIEIYVGNLSYDMTEDQLRAEFEKYGTVNSVRLVTNRHNGKSKGFAFVHMPNRPEAEKACAELNDHEVLGRKIKVNEAKNIA